MHLHQAYARLEVACRQIPVADDQPSAVIVTLLRVTTEILGYFVFNGTG
jgi:hypothetical protein